MANTINLVTKFQPLLDEVYQAASLTSDLENSAVKFDGSKTVKVLKLTVPALGTYTRNTGYTAGDVTADWEAFTLTQDRGTEFSVDAMDDEETLNMTFGSASSEFIRRSVVPQVDAYRFAAMAKAEGISSASAAISTGDAAIKAINAGMTKMDEDEVTAEGRILYITPTLKGLIDELDSYKSKLCLQRFSKIVVVPQSRFYTDVTISDSGFAKADGGNGIAALSAKVCLEQESYYYVSPAFNGSSTARDEVGRLLQECLLLTGDDAKVMAEIKNIFKKAIDECKYQTDAG